MKNSKKLLALGAGLLLFASCKKDLQQSGLPAASAGASNELQAAPVGHVYTLSNQTSANEVLVYNMYDNGKLKPTGSYPTGGIGTGGGLGSQGSVIVSDNKKLLLAVNAGSNSISSFRILENGLQLVSTVNSAGTTPISITQHNDLVYVLNAGGQGNIAGFRLNSNGMLQLINNSVRPLSDTAAGGAQISFLQDGHVLAITEKAANSIITYTIHESGKPGKMSMLPSANATPFGFAVGRNNVIYVSEAAGGATGASTLSSYAISPTGNIRLINGAIGAQQSAACWVVLTKDGRYAYTTNTGSNSLSTFRVSAVGDIKVTNPSTDAGGMAPIDATLDNTGAYMYVLDNLTHNISAFSIDINGMLSAVQTVDGLATGTVGMAAD